MELIKDCFFAVQYTKNDTVCQRNIYHTGLSFINPIFAAEYSGDQHAGNIIADGVEHCGRGVDRKSVV
jgi:hypothetical protein